MHLAGQQQKLADMQTTTSFHVPGQSQDVRNDLRAPVCLWAALSLMEQLCIRARLPMPDRW